VTAVALGGALGSVTRYLVGSRGPAARHGFPWGTLIINVHRLAADRHLRRAVRDALGLSQPVRIFLTVGICGGYTTFSTFALDAFYLIERGEAAAAGAYAIASVVLSVAALVAAMHLVRALP